jgi:REP element-mobilizing transposase RayT
MGQIPKRFPNVVLHEHIIMPNYIHGIFEIVPVGATLAVAHDNKRGRP